MHLFLPSNLVADNSEELVLVWELTLGNPLEKSVPTLDIWCAVELWDLIIPQESTSVGDKGWCDSRSSCGEARSHNHPARTQG